ncbi:PQQ-binding-like beta-propeller repeat protein [Halovenus amylolytica]|uniref:outer membrane protein assembly factor BamB family protein n=1 Tax=Halovenus amylolytica TaxID=2500550 RepID=UPI00361E1365
MRRREYLALASASVLATTAGCLGADDGSTGELRMSRYDPGNTAYVPDGTGPTDDVTEEWSFTADSSIWAPPAVVDGTVYTATGDGIVYALRDGDEEWSFEANEGVMTTPAVVDGRIYVAEGWLLDGSTPEQTTIYALDAADGEMEWEFDPQEQARIPAVVDGTVYASAGETVYALDATDGDEEWTFDVEGRAASLPAVADGTVFVATTESTVIYALDADTGDERWSVTPTGDEGSFVGAPSVSEETLYLVFSDGSTATLHAIDTADGEFRWEFEFAGTSAWPAVSEDLVLVGELVAGSEAGPATCYAIDAASGDEEWSVEGSVESNQWVAPTVVDETVYSATFPAPSDDTGTPTVQALALDDGTRRWTRDVETDEFLNASSVVDGTIHVNAGDTLSAYTEE